jgi:hypothetical protein
MVNGLGQHLLHIPPREGHPTCAAGRRMKLRSRSAPFFIPPRDSGEGDCAFARWQGASSHAMQNRRRKRAALAPWY